MKIEKHFYSCSLTYGNISRFETENMKRNLGLFLSIFNLEYTPEQVPYDAGDPSEFFYHQVVCYKSNSLRYVQRFAECLLAFCLHQGIALHEHMFE